MHRAHTGALFELKMLCSPFSSRFHMLTTTFFFASIPALSSQHIFFVFNVHPSRDAAADDAALLPFHIYLRRTQTSHEGRYSRTGFLLAAQKRTTIEVFDGDFDSSEQRVFSYRSKKKTCAHTKHIQLFLIFLSPFFGQRRSIASRHHHRIANELRLHNSF